VLSRSNRSLWTAIVVSLTTVLSGCSTTSQEPQIRIIEVPQPVRPLPEALKEPCQDKLRPFTVDKETWDNLTLQQQVQEIVVYTSNQWAIEAKQCALKHKQLIEWIEDE